MSKFVPCLFLNSLPLESVGIVEDDKEREGERERQRERHRERKQQYELAISS